MLGKLLCLLGYHDWDGHPEEFYPAPRCRRCGEWHWRKWEFMTSAERREARQATSEAARGKYVTKDGVAVVPWTDTVFLPGDPIFECKVCTSRPDIGDWCDVCNVGLCYSTREAAEAEGEA